MGDGKIQVTDLKDKIDDAVRAAMAGALNGFVESMLEHVGYTPEMHQALGEVLLDHAVVTLLAAAGDNIDKEEDALAEAAIAVVTELRTAIRAAAEKL